MGGSGGTQVNSDGSVRKWGTDVESDDSTSIRGRLSGDNRIPIENIKAAERAKVAQEALDKRAAEEAKAKASGEATLKQAMADEAKYKSQSAEEVKAGAARRAGRSSTVLTSGFGLLEDEPAVSRKRVLGL